MENNITISEASLVKLINLAYGIGHASGQMELNDLDSTVVNDAFESFIDSIKNG